MHKHKPMTMAAIDVGSNSIRMVIAEVKSKGEINILEELHKPTHIGRDTFAYGRIQVQSIHDTCDALKGFAKLMQEYRIKNYRAVSTSGIREAQNREYVLEQIRIRTGLEVEVINNAQERFLMFKAIRNHMKEVQQANSKATVIVDIGSGGVEVSVYNEGALRFTEYIKVGSLRLREILSDLERKTLDFPSLLEEFIDSRIDFLKPMITEMSIKKFIGLGGELKTIIKLINNNNDDSSQLIKRNEIKKLYSKIHTMTTAQIMADYGLPKNQAGILQPSILLFNRFLEMTDAEGIYAPMVSLRHGILADMADEWLDSDGRKEAFNDIISSVWHIGKRYNIDEVHCNYIEGLALSLFDQLGKVHRMGERERFYLKIASILHDAGKYINLNTHDIHSYNIVRFQDIMGLSERELNLVANIVRYHSLDFPSLSHENYSALSPRDQITVSKLAVLLKIAEALDISHKQKIKKMEVHISGKELHIDVWSQEDILLEEWNFSANTTFFEEVMGYKPVIKRRRS